MFTGIFAGEDSNIFVYYNEKTKIVYRAKAVLTLSGINLAKNKYNNFKEMLKDKYVCVEEDGDNNGYSQSVFMSTLGVVSIYISKSEYLYDTYSLHIDYEDAINSKSNEKKIMDDL